MKVTSYFLFSLLLQRSLRSLRQLQKTFSAHQEGQTQNLHYLQTQMVSREPLKELYIFLNENLKFQKTNFGIANSWLC